MSDVEAGSSIPPCNGARKVASVTRRDDTSLFA